MKAMQLRALGPMRPGQAPLVPADLPIPEPGIGEVRVRVLACGVCHTELDEIEGRTPPAHLPVVPGHQVVGRVDTLGDGVTEHAVGERVGIGWIHRSSGGPSENISPEFRATGRDVDGGYAEYMTVPARYAYTIPEAFDDITAAPLLCAGAVGYRALKLCGLVDGDALGFTGFGSSAQLVLQLAKYVYPRTRLFVFARDPVQREIALELGAAWAGATEDSAPEPLTAVIDTTPAWRPVLAALTAIRPGGRLVINAIRKEDADKALLTGLRYEDHLWGEKVVRTVANVTGRDIADFLPLAAEAGLRPRVETYPLEQANEALLDLRFGTIRGSKVLTL